MTEPTYRDVADWLPTDVREAIEAGTPCPVNGVHHWWHHERTEMHMMGRVEPVAIIEYWRCACGLAHTTDPEART